MTQEVISIAQTVLLWVFVIGVFFGILFGALNQIGANLYDLRQVRKNKRLKKHPYSSPNRYRPLLSIVIPVHNEEMVIERCLASILKSTYRKFEIIVADDASTDATKKIVRDFIKNHPKHNVKIAALKVNSGRGAAIDAGIAKAKGELIMALDADCTLDRFALKNAVRHFSDKKTVALAMNIRITDTSNVVSLLQAFDYIVSFRTKKFNTLANCEHIIGGAGATYRAEILKQLGGFDHTMKTEDIELSLRMAKILGSKNYHLKYASDVLIYTEPVPTYKGLLKQRFRWKFGSLQALYAHKRVLFSVNSKHSKILTWLRLPFVLWSEFSLILEPIFFSYFIYMAIKYQNLALFATACLTITIIILFAIWSDEHMSTKSRLQLSMYAPTMYVVFYVMTLIQIFAVYKTFFNLKQVTGRAAITGAYVSPERIGGQMRQS